MKVIILALTTQNSPHREHEIAGRNSWALDFEICKNVWWAVGVGDSQQDVTCDMRGVISVPIDETFNNMLTKSISAMRWLLDHVDFDFLIRTNTSTYLERFQIESLVASLPAERVYAGPLGTWSDPLSGESWQYVGGAGTILSRDAVRALCNFPLLNVPQAPDDCALGYMAQNLDLTPTSISRVALTDFLPLEPSWNFRVKDYGERHLVPEARMRSLRRLLNCRTGNVWWILMRFDLGEIFRAASLWWKHPIRVCMVTFQILGTHFRRSKQFGQYLNDKFSTPIH